MKTNFFLYILYFSIVLSQTAFSQWGPDVRLTNDPSNSYLSPNNARSIATFGMYVHVVWYDNRDGNYEIYYKRSSDTGSVWNADFRLTNNQSVSYDPAIAVNGTIVHVVWRDDRDGNEEIYYKRSTNSGDNWSTDVRLTNFTTSSMYPSVSASGSYVHVVWTDAREGNDEIFYKNSSDNGLTWSSDVRLTNNTAFSEYPAIITFGYVVLVVWMDHRHGNFEMFCKRSSNYGADWTVDTRLTNDFASSNYPSLAAFDNIVHLCWHDNRNENDEIFYKRSTDGGLNWGSDVRLTNDTAESWFPSVAVFGAIVHIAWFDRRNVNYEIYYKNSTDAGMSWGTDTRLTNKSITEWSWFPSIAISGPVLHLIWQDDRDLNREIYYKRNPTGNITSINFTENELPKEYKLYQNYPNPFNPKTKIHFSIPSTRGVQFVTLKIHDILGREVVILVNEFLLPGKYEIDFDTRQYGKGINIVSGIYFYSLITDEFQETKKMILIK